MKHNYGVTKNHLIKVEVAAFSATSAINAEAAGADRIELCSGYSEGGLSPSIGSIIHVMENVAIPVHVMCRPRAGDFIYNKHEIEVIRKEIKFYKELNVHGIVLGVLNTDGAIDHILLNELVNLARPMKVTFHRAFDLVNDLRYNLELLIDCGVDFLLTSGQKNNAYLGKKNIKELVERAGNRIRIMAGGGINKESVGKLVEFTGVSEIHLSGKTLFKSPMEKINLEFQINTDEALGDFSWYECAPDKIRAVKDIFS